MIATQNPIELDGTFPLPEAQLDRFMIRLDLGYPDEADEQEILRRRREARADILVLDPLLDPAALREMQVVLEDVFVEPSIERYIVAVVRATRDEPRCRERNPASVRRRSVVGNILEPKPCAAMASRLRWHTSPEGNMAASSRAALRGSGASGLALS